MVAGRNAPMSPWPDTRSALSGRRRLALSELRDVNRLHAECSENLQGESEREAAAVDAVDERLGFHAHAVSGKPLRKLLVGHLFVLSKLFHERLGARHVELAGVQRAYIEIELPAS